MIADKNHNAGSFHHIDGFRSAFVENRPIDVWLPPGYEQNSNQRYPVMYLHDGQMMFDNSTSPLNKGFFNGVMGWYYGGLFWDVDKTVSKLVYDETIEPVILVSVWNLPTKRGTEYMPQKMFEGHKRGTGFDGMELKKEVWIESLTSDKYLRFLVEEIKPYIDTHYRSKVDRANTYIMGSSMGGMISAYAIAEYPSLFGGAACLSTHWPAGGDLVTDWYKDNWPKAGNHRIYFDRGTKNLDAQYGRGHQQMNAIMQERGFSHGVDWISKIFEGEGHMISAWRDRLHIPLEFLLASKND